MPKRQAYAFITLEIDVVDGEALVSGYLRRHDDPAVQKHIFSRLATDADLVSLFPEWLDKLRAEAEQGRLPDGSDPRSSTRQTLMFNASSPCNEPGSGMG